MKIELISEVGSTNEYIRRYLAGGETVVVCAARQTGGKGTKGRSFLSDEGGLYLSKLTFYRELAAEEAFRIMMHAAVSVCRTAEAFQVEPEIKWANDVLVGGRKLAGILIENQIGSGLIRSSIVGIGLNVNNNLSPLGDIAVSLSSAAGRKLPLPAVREELIARLEEESTLEDYLSYVHFLGRRITVTEGERCYPAVAKRILGDGRLEVETEEGVRLLSAAEVSIKTGAI